LLAGCNLGVGSFGSMRRRPPHEPLSSFCPSRPNGPEWKASVAQGKSVRPTAMSEPLRVTHVTLSLDVGGLERNIVNQVREGHRLGQSVSVVCLERPGALAAQVEALGAR